MQHNVLIARLDIIALNKVLMLLCSAQRGHILLQNPHIA